MKQAISAGDSRARRSRQEAIGADSLKGFFSDA
jgi:hypothetical protein